MLIPDYIIWITVYKILYVRRCIAVATESGSNWLPSMFEYESYRYTAKYRVEYMMHVIVSILSRSFLKLHHKL